MSGSQQKADPVKFCLACDKPLVRKRYNGRLEDRGRFLDREHCDQTCANTRDVVGKGAHHRRARAFMEDACLVCGTSEKLQVHHVDEDYTNDDPSNLATVCASCHMKGHWREWKTQGRQISPRKEVCCQGHRMEGDNVYIRPGDGGRACRECNRERSSDFYYAHR